MEELVGQWGYLAILLGTFFEGETVLVLGGFAAHQGVLQLDLVIACAFAGSFCGDQVWFWLGRRFGRRWLDAHPGKVPAIERVTRMVDRWGTWFVLSFRFLYGVRSVSTVALGMSSIPALRFAALNLISAAVWAGLVGSLGYLSGNAVEAVLGRLQHWEHRILVALAIAAAVYAIHRLVRRYLHNRTPKAD